VGTKARAELLPHIRRNTMGLLDSIKDIFGGGAKTVGGAADSAQDAAGSAMDAAGDAASAAMDAAGDAVDKAKGLVGGGDDAPDTGDE
jgi:hypothetical protein